MASLPCELHPTAPKRIRLAIIDEVIYTKLGTTRILDRAEPVCFPLQIALYLASQIGHYCNEAIREHYSIRDDQTVSLSIQRIEALRELNPEIDVLLCELKMLVREAVEEREQLLQGRAKLLRKSPALSDTDHRTLANLIARARDGKSNRSFAPSLPEEAAGKNPETA